MNLSVQCYKADQRPVRFRLGERDYFVQELLDQWYGPEDTYFKLRADDGNLYILCHTLAADTWQLVAFRELLDR